MKRNGFTLIELLAVIVILAIIALIAVPIILNIIDDAREKSYQRSVELYASAVRNAVARYQLDNKKSPKQFSDLTIEYDGDVQCDIQKLYSDKSIYLDECTVNDSEEYYSYGKRQKPCIVTKQDPSKYSVGDVVTCKLSEGTDKFYIIEEAELTASTVQMLTEKNISTTTNRQRENAGVLKFSETEYWDYYPSSDGGYKYAYDNQSNLYSHVTVYVDYLNTKLTNSTGRLLTYSQANSLRCDRESDSCLKAPSWVYSTSYWSGATTIAGYVWFVDSYGKFDVARPHAQYGIRPVITISTSDIEEY